MLRGIFDGLGGRNRAWPATAFLLLTFATQVACESLPVSIKVKGPRDAVESTKMDPVFAPLEKKGETLALRASAFDGKGRFMGPAKDVTWSSSDPSVASVNAMGLVTILSSGKVEISAKTMGKDGQLDATIPLTAVIEKGIRIVDPKPSEQGIRLPLGETIAFRAEVLNDRDEPIDGAKVEWSSSSYSATVMPTGEVEGRAIGTAQITAKSKIGERARVDIEVVDWAKH